VVRAQRLVSSGVRRLKVFDDEPRVVYSDDRRQIGRSAAKSDLARAALAGEIGSKLTVGTDHAGGGERMLEVFRPPATPARRPRSRRP
jgi:hypothetical protein